MKTLILNVILIVVLVPFAAFGQKKHSVLVTGTLKDSFGSVIPDVQIAVKSDCGNTLWASSNPEGVFKLTLAPGVYSLTFHRPPFSDIKLVDYQVGGNRKVMMLDLSMICSNCKETDF